MRLFEAAGLQKYSVNMRPPQKKNEDDYVGYTIFRGRVVGGRVMVGRGEW